MHAYINMFRHSQQNSKFPFIQYISLKSSLMMLNLELLEYQVKFNPDHLKHVQANEANMFCFLLTLWPWLFCFLLTLWPHVIVKVTKSGIKC